MAEHIFNRTFAVQFQVVLMEKLFLPGVANVFNIEEEFIKFFKQSRAEENRSVDIDFKDVYFWEPSTSAAYLIGMLNTLKNNGYTFKITPPRNDNGVKIMLYTWRFFEVLEETIGVPVSEFCPDLKLDFQDGKNFSISSLRDKVIRYYQNIEKAEVKDYFRQRYLDETSIYLLTTSERFFPLLSLNFSTPEAKFEEFENERSRWKNVSLINGVLANNLANIDAKRKITNDVICEVISNSIIHSEADKFFIGSFFDFKDIDGNTARNPEALKDKIFNFTINLYDNGQGILDTLQDSLKKGLPIRSALSQTAFAVKTEISDMHFLIRKAGSHHELVNSNHELCISSTDQELILGAFFPGVSSKINRKGDSSEGSYFGLGLSFLMNSVVYGLGGSIAVRTGSYFLNVRKARGTELDEFLNQKFGKENKPTKKEYFKENFYYTAKFDYINGNMPEFDGNLITARIPLKYKEFNAPI